MDIARLRNQLEDDGLIRDETHALDDIEYCAQRLLLVASVANEDGRGRAAVKLFHDAENDSQLVALCQEHKDQHCKHMNKLMDDQELKFATQAATTASKPAERNPSGRNFTIPLVTGPRTKSVRSVPRACAFFCS